MTKIRFTLNALALFVFSFAFTALAQAQQVQTFIKPDGDDNARCTRAQPCRTIKAR